MNMKHIYILIMCLTPMPMIVQAAAMSPAEAYDQLARHIYGKSYADMIQEEQDHLSRLPLEKWLQGANSWEYRKLAREALTPDQRKNLIADRAKFNVQTRLINIAKSIDIK